MPRMLFIIPIVLNLLFCSLVVGTANAEPWLPLSPEAERDASRLIVMIRSQFEDGIRNGSGIIFGYRGNNIFIATANHNVRWGDAEAKNIQVFINGDSESYIVASLEPQLDSTIDLAVLRLKIKEEMGVEITDFPFDRLGDPNKLQRGDYVFSMGNPLGRPWAISLTPDRFAKKRGDQLFFESFFIAPGHSGGALWDDNLQLVGMIRNDQPPHGEALSITKILNMVKEWNYPVQLGSPPGGMFFQQVATGWGHVCGLTSKSVVYCFGSNSSGRLGSGTDVLKTDRLIRVLGNHIFQNIDVGDNFSCALDTDSRVWCWGDNYFGQLGNGLPNSIRGQSVPMITVLTEPIKLHSAGEDGSCVITLTGDTWCWGGGSRDSHLLRKPYRVAKDISLNALDVGQNYACGLNQEHDIFCWSMFNSNSSEYKAGEAYKMLYWPKFQSISLGNWDHGNGCGIVKEGKVFCWKNLYLGKYGSEYYKENVPIELNKSRSFVSINVGFQHACGIVKDSTAWCWGDNEMGQLGDGSFTSRTIPVQVKGGHKFAGLSSGREMTCGVTNDGVLYCWGNINGQIESHPVMMPGQK